MRYKSSVTLAKPANDNSPGHTSRLYWARTLRSLGPLLWRAIGKMVLAVVKRVFGLSGA